MTERGEISAISAGPELVQQLQIVRDFIGKDSSPLANQIIALVSRVETANQENTATDPKTLKDLNNKYFDYIAKRDAQSLNQWPTTFSHFSAVLGRQLDRVPSLSDPEEKQRLILATRLFSSLLQNCIIYDRNHHPGLLLGRSEFDPLVIAFESSHTEKGFEAFLTQYKDFQTTVRDAKVKYLKPDSDGSELLARALNNCVGMDVPDALVLLNLAQLYAEAARSGGRKKNPHEENLAQAVSAQSPLTRQFTLFGAQEVALRADLNREYALLADAAQGLIGGSHLQVTVGGKKRTLDAKVIRVADDKLNSAWPTELLVGDPAAMQTVEQVEAFRRARLERGESGPELTLVGDKHKDTLATILARAKQATDHGDRRAFLAAQRQFISRLDLVLSYYSRSTEAQEFREVVLKPYGEALARMKVNYAAAPSDVVGKIDGRDASIRTILGQRYDILKDQYDSLVDAVWQTEHNPNYLFGRKTPQEAVLAFRAISAQFLVDAQKEGQIHDQYMLVNNQIIQTGQYMDIIRPESGDAAAATIAYLRGAQTTGKEVIVAILGNQHERARDLFGKLVDFQTEALVTYRDYGDDRSSKKERMAGYAYYRQLKMDLFIEAQSGKLADQYATDLMRKTNLVEISVFAVPSRSLSHIFIDTANRQRMISDAIASRNLSDAIEIANRIKSDLLKDSEYTRKISGAAYYLAALGANLIPVVGQFVCGGMIGAGLVDQIQTELRSTGTITTETAVMTGLAALTFGSAALATSIKAMGYLRAASTLHRINLALGVGFAAYMGYQTFQTTSLVFEGKAKWLDVGVSAAMFAATAGMVYVGAKRFAANELLDRLSSPEAIADMIKDLQTQQTNSPARAALEALGKVDPYLRAKILEWAQSATPVTPQEITAYLTARAAPIPTTEQDLRTASGLRAFVSDLLSDVPAARRMYERLKQNGNPDLVSEIDKLLAQASNQNLTPRQITLLYENAAKAINNLLNTPSIYTSPRVTYDLTTREGVRTFLSDLLKPEATNEGRAARARFRDIRSRLSDRLQSLVEAAIGRGRIFDSDINELAAETGRGNFLFREGEIEAGGSSGGAAGGSSGNTTSSSAARPVRFGRVRGLINSVRNRFGSRAQSQQPVDQMPDFGSATPKAQTALDSLLKEAARGNQSAINKLADIVRSTYQMANESGAPEYLDLLERLLSSKTVREAFKNSNDASLKAIVESAEARLANKPFGSEQPGQRGLDARFNLEGSKPITPEQAARTLDALTRTTARGSSPIDTVSRTLGVELSPSEQSTVNERMRIMDGVSELDAWNEANTRATTARDTLLKSLEPKPTDDPFAKTLKEALRTSIEKALEQGKTFEEALLDAFKDAKVQKAIQDAYTPENTSDLSSSGREARTAERTRFMKELAEKAQIKEGENATDAFNRVLEHLASNDGTRTLSFRPSITYELTFITTEAGRPMLIQVQGEAPVDARAVYDSARSSLSEARLRAETLERASLQRPAEVERYTWEWTVQRVRAGGLSALSGSLNLLSLPARPFVSGVRAVATRPFLIKVGAIAGMALYAAVLGFAGYSVYPYAKRKLGMVDYEQRGMENLMSHYLPFEVNQMLEGAANNPKYPKDLLQWAGSDQGLEYMDRFLKYRAKGYPEGENELFTERFRDTLFKAKPNGTLAINGDLVVDPKRTSDVLALLRNMAIVNDTIQNGGNSTVSKAEYEKALKEIAPYVKRPDETEEKAIERVQKLKDTEADKKQKTTHALQFDAGFETQMHNQGLLVRKADVAAERFVTVAQRSITDEPKMTDKEANELKQFLLENPMIFYGFYQAYSEGHIPIVNLGAVLRTLRNGKDHPLLSALRTGNKYDKVANTNESVYKTLFETNQDVEAKRKEIAGAADSEKPRLNGELYQLQAQARTAAENAQSRMLLVSRDSVVAFLEEQKQPIYFKESLIPGSYLAMMDDRAYELLMSEPNNKATETLVTQLRFALASAHGERPENKANFDLYNSLVIPSTTIKGREGVVPREIWSDDIQETTRILRDGSKAGKTVDALYVDARESGLLVPGFLAYADDRLRRAEIKPEDLDPAYQGEVSSPIKTADLIKFVRARSKTNEKTGEFELREANDDTLGVGQWIYNRRASLVRADKSGERPMLPRTSTVVEVIHFTMNQVTVRGEGENAVYSEETGQMGGKMTQLDKDYFNYKGGKYKWDVAGLEPKKGPKGESATDLSDAKKRARRIKEYEEDPLKSIPKRSYGTDGRKDGGTPQARTSAQVLSDAISKITEFTYYEDSGRRSVPKTTTDRKKMVDMLNGMIAGIVDSMQDNSKFKGKSEEELRFIVTTTLLNRITQQNGKLNMRDDRVAITQSALSAKT